jgi:hypothetical protein
VKFIILLLISMAAWGQDPRSERAVSFFKEIAEQVITEELTSVLENGQIIATESELIDNTGSLVDAIGIPGKVTLSTQRWLTFMREGRDVRLLVLHELLRMAGENDDNYIISRRILPTHNNQNESRPYCDLRVSATKITAKTKKVKGVGFLPPANGVLFFSNQIGREMVKRAHEDINDKCQKLDYIDGYRIIGGGNIVMSNRNTNGFIRNEQTITLNAECIKNVSTKRSAKEQKMEGCRKVSLCRELLSEGVISPLHPEDMQELDEVTRKWRCQ